MSKINRILLAVFGVIILFFVINLAQNQSNQKVTKDNSSQNNTVSLQKDEFSPQENDGGNVTVTAKPKVLQIGEKPVFEVEFNTHSVELDFDVAQVTKFTDDQGKEYTNPVWEGSPPGGHHRSGILTFPNPLSETKSVELIIKNVSGIPERRFFWKL